MIKNNDYKNKILTHKGFFFSGKIKMKLVLFFAASVTFLIFAQLVFAGNLAVDGQKLAYIEEQIKILETENTNLKVEIAKETSLANLSLKADLLGFQKPGKIIETN